MFKNFDDNPITFTIISIAFLVIFMSITNGLGIWEGLSTVFTNIFARIFNSTYYGFQFVGEAIWFMLLVPFIFIFKKEHIFCEKRKSLGKTLLGAWPILIYASIALVRSLIQIGNYHIDIYEMVALLLYTLFIGTFEEVMCRGILQNEFLKRFGNTKKGVLFSIIVSGSLFGLLHFVNLLYAQDIFTTFSQVLMASIIGVAFGSIYYDSKNIWSVIILHAFWDFSIFVADINAANTCIEVANSIETVTPFLALFAFFGTLLSKVPEFGVIFLFLNGQNIEKIMSAQNGWQVISEEKQNKTFKRVISIVLVAYLVIVGSFTFNMGKVKSNSCPEYVPKKAENYSEEIFSNDHIEVILETEECLVPESSECALKRRIISFIKDNNELIVNDKDTEKSLTLDYNNVVSYMAIKTDDKYDIFLLNMRDDGDIIVYRNTITADVDLEQFQSSFSQVLLPPTIEELGIYREKDNEYSYPLFISSTGNRYIISQDGTIYSYDKS